MERINLFLRENIRLLLGLAVVIFVLVLLITLLLSRKGNPEVKIGNETFKVEVAESETEKQTGLSEKTTINEDQGMLFVFNKPDTYSFWMKEMDFAIDIIYINGDKVTTVIHDAQPPTSSSSDLAIYRPEEPSDKVLEIKAGLAEKYNITKGTTVEINNL